MKKIKIDIEQLNKDLPVPEYKHLGEDAGLDLRAAHDEVINPREWKLIKTGIRIAIPQGYGGFVHPRSGLALKKGITVLNADGVIDPGYRGEVGVILINHGKEPFEINFGDRIAQLIIKKTPLIQWNVVDNLDDTKRAEGGFGHTGVK